MVTNRTELKSGLPPVLLINCYNNYRPGTEGERKQRASWLKYHSRIIYMVVLGYIVFTGQIWTGWVKVQGDVMNKITFLISIHFLT